MVKAVSSKKKFGKKQFTYLQCYEYKRKLELKTLELEVYESLHCFKDSSNKDKLEAVEKHFSIYPVKTMCRVINLHYATFYNYHFRRIEVTEYEKWDNFLKTEINRIFKESDGRFGANKILQKLTSEGTKTTLSKISKLMKELNLKSKQCKKHQFIQKQSKLLGFKNKLNRNFTQCEPNIYWVSDVTTIKIGYSCFYLCAIIDLFSRKIIAYRLSSQNNSSLTINTFKDAFEKRKRPSSLSFHSDQGANYTSEDFRGLLKSLKVNQSFSKKGNPYDNAVMESIFSNLKREEMNSHDFEFFEELQVVVDDYMKFYNNYRPHKSLKNKTPNQVEQDYCNQMFPDTPT